MYKTVEFSLFCLYDNYEAPGEKMESKKSYRRFWNRFCETVNPGTLNSIQENYKCCE